MCMQMLIKKYSKIQEKQNFSRLNKIDNKGCDITYFYSNEYFLRLIFHI